MVTRAFSGPFCALALSVCLCSTFARAGAIEVRLREKEGPGLANVLVGLTLLADPSGAPAPPTRRGAEPRAQTDLSGKAVFEGLQPGVYRIWVGALPEPLIRPGEHHFNTHPVATLETESDRVRVEVEVRRGTPVTVEIVTDADRHPRGRLRFREIHRGEEFESGFLHRGWTAEETLPAGVWEVTYEVLSGQLLVGLERDGAPLPGDRVVLDLLEDRQATLLTFRFTAPCRLSGRLYYQGKDQGGVEILATLVEPGPWIDAARERGSVVERAAAWPRRGSWDYTLELPEGVWEVRPVGEVLVSSEPESRILTLAPGGEARADFDVLREEGDGRTILEIRARTPNGGRVNGVLVEAWPSESEPARDEPSASAESQYGGRAFLSGLESGDYRIVAAHADYLETETRVEDFDSEGRRRKEEVTLELGGVIHVRARDGAGGPLSAATLHVERLSDPPPSLLASDKIREAKRSRRAVTDATGIARLTGFEDGEYRLHAELSRADAAEGFALVSLPGKSGRSELELALDEDSRQEVEIGFRPAGRLSGRLVCRDRGALPSSAAFQVLSPAHERNEDERTVLAVEDQPLDGPLRDGFRVGPLEEGAYLLVARPVGHALWTFAPGTPDPEEASPLQVTAGEGLDLGILEVYCGPVIVVSEDRDAEEEGPSVDLRRAELRSDLLVEVEPGRQEPIRFERQSSVERVLFWDLPAGKATLDLEIDHPHFLEPRPRRVSRELELERGHASVVPLPPGGLGGAILVPGPGAAAQGRSESGELVTAPLREGRAELAHLSPGLWTVSTCEDPGCETLLREWAEVLVEPCEDTELKRSAGRTVASGP
jgi:hypothetical protein